jgi:hypothetical protein
LGPGPAGRWLTIAADQVTAHDLDLADATRTLALTAVALADASIASWAAKYQHNVIRPVTYIQRHIDPAWAPLLPTPGHPEFPAGHSAGAAAAATVLTASSATARPPRGTPPAPNRTANSRPSRTPLQKPRSRGCTPACTTRWASTPAPTRVAASVNWSSTARGSPAAIDHRSHHQAHDRSRHHRRHPAGTLLVDDEDTIFLVIARGASGDHGTDRWTRGPAMCPKHLGSVLSGGTGARPTVLIVSDGPDHRCAGRPSRTAAG